jgi:methyl-accepting chemotaxis protein
MTQTTSPKPETKARWSLPRPSLLTQILLNGVVPIVLFTGSYLMLSSRSSSASFERLIQDSAKQVAISIGSTVKRENFTELGGQLAALTEQSNVAFIYVRSEVADEWRVKPELQAQFDKTVIKALYEHVNQSRTGLLWNDDSNGYLGLRETYAKRFGGQLPSAISDAFQAQGQAALTRTINAYQIEQIGVTESAAGRSFGPATPGADFTIMVGMKVNQNIATINEQNRNLLLAGVLFSILSVLISALVARGITRPILTLIQTADAMSLGNLETPIQATGGRELGKLAEALERVRLSLTVLMKRARSNKPGNP